ncbi:hypothetical protein [Hoylesella saccharolytica]|uniref:hypothetical protein n=1 Tax=Hoylesella saccharolytica TaxID=633701 RepID=UPI0028EF81BD|nr:hypothetical protein [Hoylesella saccharolytica]
MKKQILSMFFLLGAMMFTACGNREEAEEKNDGKIVMTAAQFTLTEEPYGEETEVISRALGVLPQPQIVDLGNGIEAEVSIEREQNEVPRKATRAKDISNQHYTIMAYKLGTGRVGGTLKGTVSGTGATKTFTPDPGTQHKIVLPPGTYTFFCFNDKVADDGSFGYVVQQANAEQALFDYKTVTISGKHYHVNFEMKHQAARMRFEITTYWDITGIKATASANHGLKTIYYDDLMSNYMENGGAVTSSEFTFPNVTTAASNYSYISTSDYRYFLCSFFNGVQTASNLKINFTSGSLYGRSLAGKSMMLTGFSDTQLGRNKSYKVKIRLLYSYNYLFHDGSVSTLAVGRKARKTPIGACTIGNRAMALRSVGLYKWGPSISQWDNVGHSENLNDHKGVIWGWELTYHAAQSYDHTTIKANSISYSAFYQAAHYNPGVPTSGIGQWYLPSLGEFLDAYKAIGNFDRSSVTGSWGDYTKDWNGKLYRVVFVQAGGAPTLGEWCWTSQEYSMGDAVNCGCSNEYIRLSSYPKNQAMNFVRPFVKY